MRLTRKLLACLALVAAAGAMTITSGSAVGATGVTDEDATIASQRSAIVNAAHYYLNQRTPYVWSSGEEPCSVNGADCECLNRLAYRRGAGIQLPYTLYGQRHRGTRTSNPRPGDLVFFDLTGDGDVVDAHDHTGVFVGDGMMIHASSYWGRVYKQSVRSFVDYERTRAVYVRILS